MSSPDTTICYECHVATEAAYTCETCSVFWCASCFDSVYFSNLPEGVTETTIKVLCSKCRECKTPFITYHPYPTTPISLDQIIPIPDPYPE